MANIAQISINVSPEQEAYIKVRAYEADLPASVWLRQQIAAADPDFAKLGQPRVMTRKKMPKTNESKPKFDTAAAAKRRLVELQSERRKNTRRDLLGE